MADTAMTVLLESLSQTLVSCSDLISGAEDELRLLRDEVDLFRNFLRDAASNRQQKSFRKMERQIEELIYNAQDTIDSYMIEAATAAAQSKINLRPRRHVLVTETVRRLAEDVRSFREKKVNPVLDKAIADFPNMLLNIGDGSVDAIPLDPSSSKLRKRADPEGLENISDLVMILGGGGRRISAAEEELRLLKEKLELLSVFVQNAAGEAKETKPYRKTLSRIKRVVVDAKRLTGYYLRQVSAAKCKTELFRRRRDLYTKPVGSLAEAVRSFREDTVRPMLEKARIDFAEMLQISSGSGTSLEEPHRIKVPSIDQYTVVPVEDEQEMITRYLIEGTEELDVVSIIGGEGMGKTTLARQIYQSQQIQYEFPTRIWVTFSEDLRVKDAFLNILNEVTSKDMSSISDDDLASTVHHFLEKRKFLLVLDDVIGYYFDRIQVALPKNSRGSKVLVTGVVKEVVPCAWHSIAPHKLRLLREDECWELLQLHVFGGLRICPSELIEIGQHIARKCAGVPLIVVLIGGVLVDHLSKTQSMSALRKAWTEVLEYMRKYSTYGTSNFIVRAIELSCNRLPDELRNLLLYLGVFPEGCEIPTSTLIRLWIAEGFIRHQEGRSLEDIAEEKLNHLVQRKLVIVDKMSNGEAKMCRLHSTVHSFCTKEGIQVNLFQVLKEYEASLEQKKHRRLFLHSNLLEHLSPYQYFPSAHSFLCFYKTESLLLPENTSKIPGYAFELLRILHMKHVRFTRFPLELTQLFFLRYIVLSSNFKVLPEAISMLKTIQTLVIHTSSRTLEIKADIWKMIQLRHLQTNASITLLKEPGNHSDQELQTLTNLSPENCTSSVFNRACCLKKLGIRGMLPILLDGEVGSRKFDHFEKMKELENLKLLNDVHMSSPSECLLSCLPPPDKFPPKLRSLKLSATFLSWEHMSILGELEKLEVLKLRDNAFVGECWEVADGSFPSLRVLQIGYTNLVSWKAAQGHFPKLRSLTLRNCEKLDALPQHLRDVLSLREIELLRPSKSLAASARKIEEERRQIEGNFRIKLSIYHPADE